MDLDVPRRAAALALTLLVAGAGAGAAAVVPDDAAAAGFSPPVAVSPKGQVAQAAAAVAPTGRTAVVWLAAPKGARGQGWRVVARVGDTPERLAPAAEIRGSARAFEPRAVAAPDGTVTVCWSVEAYRRRGAIRCAVASGGRPFGAARTLASYRRGTQLSLTGLAVDGAGRSVVAWKRSSGRERYSVVVAIGGANGRFGRPATLGTSDPYADVALATGGAGEVAAVWSVPDGRAMSPRTPMLATLAPGAGAFSRAVAVEPPVADEGTPSVRGGRGLSLVFSGEDGPVALLRGTDGALRPAPLAPAKAVPGAFPTSSLVSLQPDGTAVAVTRFAAVADTDCSEETRSQLFAGTLPAGAPGPPATLVPLSDPRQLVAIWDVAELDDGRTIVLWGDGFGPDRETRLEFAVRTPDGAFTPATTIAPTAADLPVLASAGRHAILAYIVGERLDGPGQVLLSTFRDTGPFAPTGPRPAHPSTGCA